MENYLCKHRDEKGNPRLTVKESIVGEYHCTLCGALVNTIPVSMDILERAIDIICSVSNIADTEHIQTNNLVDILTDMKHIYYEIITKRSHRRPYTRSEPLKTNNKILEKNIKFISDTIYEDEYLDAINAVTSAFTLMHMIADLPNELLTTFKLIKYDIHNIYGTYFNNLRR